MYITAHRVRSKRNRTAVNAFLHLHGPGQDWPNEPTALLNMGRSHLPESSLERIGIKSDGGLPVLSYIEILAPDDISRTKISNVIDLLQGLDASAYGGLIAIVQGKIGIKLSLPRWRVGAWRRELELLVDPIEDLLRGRGWTSQLSHT